MEEWKECQDFPNYEVSNLGSVRNKKNKRILKQSQEDGYCYLILCKDTKQHKIRVHRLVGLAFLENPDNKPQIDHINRIRNDNRVCNLRWATAKENRANMGDIIHIPKQEVQMTDEKPSYYQLNRDRILAQRKQYNQENKDKIKEYQKEYFQKNKDKFAEKNRKWRLAHPVPKKERKNKKQPTPKKKDLPQIPFFTPEPEPEPEPTVIYTNKPIIVTFD